MYKKYKINTSQQQHYPVSYISRQNNEVINIVSGIIVAVLPMAKPLPIVIFGLKTKLTSVRHVYVTGQNL